MNGLKTSLIIHKNHSSHVMRRPNLIHGWVSYEEHNDKLDFNSIKRLLNWISGIHNKYRNYKPPLAICFPMVRAVDKLTLQVLECILFSLINDFHHRVIVDMHIAPQIHSEGFKYSPLQYLCLANYDVAMFNKSFESDMKLNHYRRVVPKEWTFNGQLGELIFPDTMRTLKNYIDDENYAFTLVEVITELLNNANEHNEADCLLDLDITGNYQKSDGSEGEYFGVNVSVISFADISIYDPIQTKIKSKKYTGDRYDHVSDAYEHQKTYFNEEYSEADFFTTAVFQDKISGRLNHDSSGGTGLTKLLQSLEKYSDSSMCYMVSNKRALYFFNDLLDYDHEGWIAFNHESDLYKPPEPYVFQTSPILLPGIGYNLTFVYKKGACNYAN